MDIGSIYGLFADWAESLRDWKTENTRDSLAYSEQEASLLRGT